MRESPVVSSSSSVVLILSEPPIIRVPEGEDQLQWLRRFSTSWCDGDQLSPLSLTQVVRVADLGYPPPHASSPDCVWK